MRKKSIGLCILVIMCAALLVTSFVGCDDDPVVVHKVTFDSIGGSLVQAVDGVVNTEPVTVKEGYDFEGWYTDATYSGERVAFPYTPAADVILYAKWAQKEPPVVEYTVTFNSNGGSRVNPVKGSVEKEPVPRKDGWIFEGWYVEGNEERIKFPYTPTADVTLTAKWSESVLAPSFVIGEIITAAEKQGLFSNETPFGGSLTLEVGTYKIAIDIYMNPANANDVRIGIEISNNGVNVISLYADDVNVYAVTADANKRFVNVNLAEIIKDVAYPSGTEVSDGYSLVKTVLSVLFSSGKADGQDGVYSVEASLKNIVELVSIVVPDIPQEVLDVVSQISLRLDADVKGGSLNSLEMTAITQLGNVNAKVSEFKIANDYNPGINVPAKDAAGFDESYLLNFTLEGSVTLSDYKSGTYTDKYSMNYEIRVNYNLASALRNAVKIGEDGSVSIDPRGFFSDSDNKIYINLSHKCAEEGCNFCTNNREGGSRGSFLTIAYSPEDFGSNNINIAANVKQILPKGLLGQVVDLGGMDIITMFEEYIGLGIDPVAMMINQDNYKDTAEALSMAGNGSTVSLDGMNPLGLVLDVLRFASEITKTGNEVRISASDIVELCDNFTALAGFNIAQVVGMFFGDCDYMTISVDKAIYGDPETANIDLYGEYMIIDESISEYKKFTLNGTDNTPVKNIEWIVDKDGNVKITSPDVQNYKEDGSAYSISADEAKMLFESGYAHYTAYMMDGSVKESTAGIKAVYGLDYTKTDVPQEVLVVTNMTDAGSMSGLLSIVAGFVPGMDLNFAGNYFKTTVTISSLKGEVQFYQTDDVIEEAKYDAEKVYVNGTTLLNPEFTAKVEYANGETKEIKVLPENYSELFGNYSNKNAAYTVCFDDFTMVYNVFGKVYELPVKVDETVKYTKPVTQSIAPNTVFSTGYKFTYYYMQDGQETSSSYYTMKNVTAMKLNVVSGNADAVIFENVHTMGSPETANITFTEGGVYEIDLYLGRGLTQRYTFNVAEAKPVLPGYAVSGSYLGNEITLDVVRTLNDGNGINADIVVSVPDGDTVKTLQRGTDYEVYVEENGVRTKVDASFFLKKALVKPARFVLVFTDVANVSADTKISFTAVDYDNAVICSTETLKSAFESYTITAEYKTTETEAGNYIEYSAICPDDKAIKDLQLRVELKLKVDGAEEWTVKEPVSLGYVDSSMAMFGMFIPTPVDGAQFVFSAEGKYDNGEACCIVLKDIASADVVFEINVYAVNYGDVLVATATNA